MKCLIFFLLCIIQSCYSQISRDAIVRAYKEIYALESKNEIVSRSDKKSIPEPLLLYALAVGIDILNEKPYQNWFLISRMEKEAANKADNKIFYYRSLGSYTHMQIGHNEIANALYEVYKKPCSKEQILNNFAAHLLRHSIRIEGIHEEIAIWVTGPLLRATIKSVIKDTSLKNFGNHIAYEIGITALWRIPDLILDKIGFYEIYKNRFSRKR